MDKRESESYARVKEQEFMSSGDIERFSPRIFTVRGMPVMLDSDLALLYDVTTGNFNKAVSRNAARFPEGVFVCPYTRGSCKLDIPNWNIKRAWRTPETAPGVYGAWSDHGCNDFE